MQAEQVINKECINMSVFKCKMCGGTIEFSVGDTVGVCDSCGTKQTLPRLDDDKKANLYDRANHFRRSNDFDKAMSIYDKILNEDSTDAEAYWSLVLCRYGIEYVEDPSTHKRIPTVNRAQYTSIFADEDYKSALQYADASQREIYESEAAVIDNIQKGILEISSKEEPFDVFICYKETDSNGRRTHDSVLANDLYHQLTQEGFKVFFSRITLEDKLGTAYEPYIFAALNSAKVMVVIGTKPEYFNAVWVKNEWSRYLALIRGGAKKMLIPAYRDMDPYDLPEEFSHLQAQDMSKLGFMQDLIRGIKKITAVDEPKTVVKETIVNSGNTNIQPLLKRVFMFLEDGNFAEADEYCEKILDIDPECAQAYLGKLMAQLKVKNQEQLINCEKTFDDNNNYQKLLRFGDKKLVEEAKGWITAINERNELARLTAIYDNATEMMNKATSEETFKEAAMKFESIQEFKDSKELAEKCLEQAEISQEISRKNSVYALAKGYMTSTSSITCRKAIAEFQSIPGWKDADQLLAECQNKVGELEREEEEKRIETERRKQEEIGKAKKKRKIKIITSVSTVCVVTVATLLFIFVINPMMKYNKAVKYFDNGEYMEARKIFYEMYDYKDSKKYFDSIVCKPTQEVYVNPDGSVSTNEYEYSPEGNLLKETDIDPDGSFTSSEYTYDSNGNVTTKVDTDSDGSVSTAGNTYDSNNNIIKSVSTYSDGSVDTWKYTYDSKGNETKAVWTESDGGVDTWESTYDSKGNKTKRVYTGSDGSITTFEYTYDSKGNLTKRVYTGSDGKVSSYEYTYDSNGNVTKKVYTDSDGKSTISEYTLDDVGRLTKEIYTNEDGEVSTYELKFNKYNQITDKIYDSDTTTRSYDKNGFLTKSEVSDSDGVSTCEYRNYVCFKKEEKKDDDVDEKNWYIDSSAGDWVYDNIYE